MLVPLLPAFIEKRRKFSRFMSKNIATIYLGTRGNRTIIISSPSIIGNIIGRCGYLSKTWQKHVTVVGRSRKEERAEWKSRNP
jgi:hypothetical protein